MGANESKPEKNIVLFGKTGVGKSSAGNTILRQQVFEATASPTSMTADCTSGSAIVNGRKITIIDTPGMCDTVVNEEAVRSEIIKTITELDKSPDMFVMILKVERYTGQEMDVVNMINSCIKQGGEDTLEHISILFTHGEDLEGQTIEEFVKKSSKLKELVDKCGGCCHVIDSKYWKQLWGYKSNRVQVRNLLKSFDEIFKQEKHRNTNIIFKIVRENIQEEMKNIKEENLSEEEKYERAKQVVYKKLLIRLAGVATGTLIGAFLGIGVAVACVVALLKGEMLISTVKDMDMGSAIAAGVALGAAGLIGAVGGGITGWEEAKEADSVTDAIKKTAKASYETAKDIVNSAKTENKLNA